jgi:myxalamid-type polyketide synthase MxaC
MDPQQKIILELVYESLQDAGITMDMISNSNTGVFIGSSTNDFQLLQHDNRKDGDIHTMIGSTQSMISNRVSYFYNLKGPSVVVNSSCSSSLLSVHHGIQSLRCNESNMVIVGGINLILSEKVFESLNKSNILSEDNKCKTFDDSADGVFHFLNKIVFKR